MAKCSELVIANNFLPANSFVFSYAVELISKAKSFFIFQGESLEAAACHRGVNHTRIAVMISDGAAEYFIISEQKPLCKVPTLKIAIFMAFAAYFAFNLEYPKQVKNLLTFLQDFVLNHPDASKRHASYLGITTDINHYEQRE